MRDSNDPKENVYMNKREVKKRAAKKFGLNARRFVCFFIIFPFFFSFSLLVIERTNSDHKMAKQHRRYRV